MQDKGSRPRAGRASSGPSPPGPRRRDRTFHVTVPAGGGRLQVELQDEAGRTSLLAAGQRRQLPPPSSARGPGGSPGVQPPG